PALLGDSFNSLWFVRGGQISNRNQFSLTLRSPYVLIAHGRVGRAFVQGRALGAGRTRGACSRRKPNHCPSRFRCGGVTLADSGDRAAAGSARDLFLEIGLNLPAIRAN